MLVLSESVCTAGCETLACELHVRMPGATMKRSRTVGPESSLGDLRYTQQGQEQLERKCDGREMN